MKALLAKAQLTRFNRVKDGSVNLTFQTMEEISNEDFALMDQYWKQNGWLAFKLNEVEVEDLPKENATVEGDLTPSQYLRRNLYALHIAKGGKKEDFPAYYNKAMAGFAEAVQRQFPD